MIRFNFVKNLGFKIVSLIQKYQQIKRCKQKGPVGDYWKDGGNDLLYQFSLTSNDLIIDAGGYKGDWTANMIIRYGCKSHIYEPIPEFYTQCNNLFKNNDLVKIFNLALGSSERKANFYFLDNGSTEFNQNETSSAISVNVVDVFSVIKNLNTQISCIKLNIEGGEYEVLERLIETNTIVKFNFLLLQFHKQPINYLSRYDKIIEILKKTHTRVFNYEFVWEKWKLNEN